MTNNVVLALIDRIVNSWPWYLARGSGIIASVLLLLLILGGIGQVTGHVFRILEPISAWANHRRLGIALTVAVLVHIISLLFDTSVKFNLGTVLVPFISYYRPLYVGLGILAFYALIAVTVTSLLWTDTHPRFWKTTHYLSYAILGLVFIHALFSGTDLASGIPRLLWIIGGVLILAAIIPRLRRAGSLR